MTRHANLELRTYNFEPTTDREITHDLPFGWALIQRFCVLSFAGISRSHCLEGASRA